MFQLSQPYKANMKSILLLDIPRHSISTQHQKTLLDLADQDLNQLALLKNLQFTFKNNESVALYAKNKEKHKNALHLVARLLYNKSIGYWL